MKFGLIRQVSKIEDNRTVSICGNGGLISSLTREQKEKLLEQCNSLEDIIEIIDGIRDLPEIIVLEKVAQLWDKPDKEPTMSKKSKVKSWKKKRFYD